MFRLLSSVSDVVLCALAAPVDESSPVLLATAVVDRREDAMSAMMCIQRLTATEMVFSITCVQQQSTATGRWFCLPKVVLQDGALRPAKRQNVLLVLVRPPCACWIPPLHTH